jgi:hypothetical protein
MARFTDTEKYSTLKLVEAGIKKGLSKERAVSAAAAKSKVGESTVWEWLKKAKEERPPTTKENRDRLQEDGLGQRGAMIVGLGLQSIQAESTRLVQDLRSAKNPPFDDIRQTLAEWRGIIDGMLSVLGD